ncbi:uncharacterized protein LOC131930713 [Physella acuta]|uniref:uncharacterized protein LOC131930713 n=1 Tax=Physella acuta TaxID=109671 RepID=UPI0027DB3733|nr:uncharacterized protein LOC131930713 [Physella acuta]XP_059143283.1 uncharacterized protein LOC131930713 [Physella acuta]XP_059143285.1 uncharacterized protein LOC131930713 [Physella acuta]
MTSLLLVTTMSSSESSRVLAATSSMSPFDLLTSAPARDLDADIRDFWSSFPCPPPWKPRLLIEVNSSRLLPHIRNVQTFLAGKCEIKHILFPSDVDPNLGPQRGNADVDFRLTEAPDHGSPLGDLATSEHTWCDVPCQLSIGSAIFFVVVVMLVAMLVCVTKHRVRHKMAATRPSRQQLQLSTSTSDAVNCTDFSNLEVQGDDDLIYPPFRHRGLPNPPAACHPSCDPKWNCPSCASRHPLMRLSPTDQCYSRAYSAVYETIDDDDDDDDVKKTDTTHNKPRGRTPSKSNSRESYNSCSPCQTSPTSISTVQIRPRANDDSRGVRQIAETGFNGEEGDIHALSLLPNYFELDHSCALSELSSLDTFCPQPARTAELVTACCTRNSQMTSHPAQYPNLSGMALHSFLMTQIHQDVIPTSDLLQTTNPPGCHLEELRSPPAHTHSRSPHVMAPTPPQHTMFSRGLNGYDYGQSLSGYHPSEMFTNYNTMDPTPSPFYCPSCVHSPVTGSSTHVTGTSLQGPGGRDQAGIIGPDLLKEASNQMIQELTVPQPPQARDENHEVPLRKPVLALHSQYFAKTSAA